MTCKYCKNGQLGINLPNVDYVETAPFESEYSILAEAFLDDAKSNAAIIESPSIEGYNSNLEAEINWLKRKSK